MNIQFLNKIYETSICISIEHRCDAPFIGIATIEQTKIRITFFTFYFLLFTFIQSNASSNHPFAGRRNHLLQSHQYRLRLFSHSQFQRMGQAPCHCRSGDCKLQRRLLFIQHQSMGLLVEQRYAQLEIYFKKIFAAMERNAEWQQGIR